MSDEKYPGENKRDPGSLSTRTFPSSEKAAPSSVKAGRAKAGRAWEEPPSRRGAGESDRGSCDWGRVRRPPRIRMRHEQEDGSGGARA